MTTPPILPDTAHRCIATLCEPLGCSDCNCAVPADVYAVLMRSAQDRETEAYAKGRADQLAEDIRLLAWAAHKLRDFRYTGKDARTMNELALLMAKGKK